MPINPVWPKPYKWLVDPRLVHPGQRWVWHTKPRFIVPPGKMRGRARPSATVACATAGAVSMTGA